MKPIRLPEPPSGGMGVPDIFEGGVDVIRRAIVISNGTTAAENQSVGLVRALGLADKLSIYRVTRQRWGVNEWLHWLSRLIRQIFTDSRFATSPPDMKSFPFPGLLSILEEDGKKIASIASETYKKEGPLLVVACGHHTVSIASSVKHLASEKVFVIQVQHPRSCLDRFDLVITPRHDYYALTASGQQEIPRIFRRWITPQDTPGSNVVFTIGALHQADSTALRLAANAWHDELAPLPKPLLVVNIGGPTRNCKYSSDLATQLVGSLQNVLASCGSVIVSFSRRTPMKVFDIVKRDLGGHPKIYIWDGEDPNLHMGQLAWADAFVITTDSISMLSEACSTGKPIYVIGSEHCKWKFSAFHKTLRERGAVRPFTGFEDMSNTWSYPPLNDAAEVAAQVRDILAKRGLALGH
ncbi:mitochondrial fission protein ELM1-like [Zingiber officinale]|uniref:mitochondrial fission protein ELM1-like n=1 Tax=Zingiber officinale TaxID=94328 RepID=UPI001C4AFBAF|nr:mitochondrial fission protein ELM1-like [Zingiber officinale]